MKKTVYLILIILNMGTMNSQDFSKLENYFDNKITGKEIPGVQFLVADNSGILFEYNKGKANIDKNIEVNSQTQFKMFSQTKLLTMIAVMKLVEEGKISLESPVSKYIDIDFPKEITVRRTLSHTAGFSKYPFVKSLHLASEHDSFSYTKFMNEQIPKHQKLKYKPGNKNMYSNYGYLILSKIIEEVSGIEYETFVKENIIEKAELDEADHIGFDYNSKTATAYQKRKTFIHWMYSLLIDKKKYYGSKTKTWQSFHDLYMEGIGFGGGFANSRAVATLILSLMNEGIISKSTLNETFEIQQMNNGKNSKNGLGWWHGKVSGYQSYYHPGGGGGYSCEVRIYPKKGLVRVMMMNKTQTFKDLKMYKEIDELWLK